MTPFIWLREEDFSGLNPKMAKAANPNPHLNLNKDFINAVWGGHRFMKVLHKKRYFLNDGFPKWQCPVLCVIYDNHTCQVYQVGRGICSEGGKEEVQSKGQGYARSQ